MTWNHRVVYHGKGSRDSWYGVHEVYYDKKSRPSTCTVDAVSPMGETVDELGETLAMMQRALTHPVLSYEDDFVGDDLCEEARAEDKDTTP